MSIILNVLKVLAVLYGVLLLLMFLFQKYFIFFPTPLDRSHLKPFSNYEISFAHDGVLLHGWFVRREISVSSPLIIYYGGNAEEVSGNLLDLEKFPPSSFLFVNYRGYGDSTGSPSEESLVKDAIYILDKMVAEHQIDLDHIVLMGRSLGSGVAVQVASKRKVAGVILVTPFDSLMNVAKSHYPIFPIRLLLRHKFDSAKMAKNIDIPAVILIGNKDSVIPATSSTALVEAWKGPKQLVQIDNADHNDIQLHHDFWNSISSFLSGLGST